jgi:hypothetical protein
MAFLASKLGIIFFSYAKSFLHAYDLANIAIVLPHAFQWCHAKVLFNQTQADPQLVGTLNDISGKAIS